VHSDQAGFDRRWYRERGMTWLIRCVELDVLDGVDHGTRFDISTEVVGWRRVWARRRSEFHTADRERTRAVAMIDWVLVGDNGTPIRVPPEITRIFAGRGIGTFTPGRVALEGAAADATRYRFTVRRRDVDPLAHVNNATYLDLMEEALIDAGHGDAVAAEPRRFRVEYLVAAELGQDIEALTWPDEHGWAHRLSGADGRELLRARLETNLAEWVGA
jgi:acyl-ACP thioesterase